VNIIRKPPTSLCRRELTPALSSIPPRYLSSSAPPCPPWPRPPFSLPRLSRSSPSSTHAQEESWRSPPRYPTLGSQLVLPHIRLATGERTSQIVRCFTSGFSERVVRDAADGIAEALLELHDIFLVGGGDLGDLVCGVLALVGRLFCGGMQAGGGCLVGWKGLCLPLAM
jgi:hypothetical protein